MSSRTLVWIVTLLFGLSRANANNLPTNNSESLHWTSEAKLNRFPKSLRGSFAISSEGVDFHPAKGQTVYWELQDIRTVDLQNPRKLSLITYENRRWHTPGDRPFDFKLDDAVPPSVAAELVRLVGKPAMNIRVVVRAPRQRSSPEARDRRPRILGGAGRHFNGSSAL